MSTSLEFLGLGRPPLHSAAEFLLRRYTAGSAANLEQAIAVLPGGRAGRRLLEILVDAAEARSLILTPPTIVTVGELPEKLYHPKRPFATELVQQLAWVHVLRRSAPALLQTVVARPPEPDDWSHWLELGAMLSRLHTELAADGLDFEKVAERGGELGAFGERARWEVLRQVQTAYLALLDSLHLWDLQTARLEAVKRRECLAEQDVFLIGAVDMPKTLREMLDQVADRVTALVAAPPEWAERFDRYGCLLPQVWRTVSIALDENRVHVADAPSDQADRVARCLAAYDGAYRPDEITIGLPDETIRPHVERRLQQCGLMTHWAAGVPLPQTGPFRLLAAIADYLEADQYPEFAALVRHPDLYEWLDRQHPGAGWLEQLDVYYNAHLQTQFGERWLGERGEYTAVRRVYQAVQGLLRDLAAGTRPLDQWSAPLRELLLTVYGDRKWNPEERTYLRAFAEIDARLTDHARRVPAGLVPSVSAADALRLALDQLSTMAVPLPLEPAAVELLGWLELPLDDAPALVVCSLNQGYVPKSVNSDMFLPNALRSRLELQDNDRRFARDAYALGVLLATRRNVDLIVGRCDADNNPLPPSRLLFAADSEIIVRRALRFFRPPPPRSHLRPLEGRLATTRPQSNFPVPRPAPLAALLAELAITAFRDYLACPYRFYLRRVLHLSAVDDAAAELDGGAFGTLLHAALRDFGAGPSRDSTDPEEIAMALNEAVTRHVAPLYGGRPLAAVEVQVEQLRLRLRAFAEKQAAWAAQGWRIEFTEVPDRTHGAATFLVDGQPIVLRGRMDRIDVHRETGERVVLDYKSSDSAERPEKAHQQGGDWVDLQLPLYRHLVRSLGIDGPVRLGYVLLPKATDQVEFRLAEWTADDLRTADEKAAAVVRDIRAERFWPPTDPPPDFSEEYAPICQDGVFDRGV
jgi:RecB family exonuclease